jgi:hypothetical protein
MRVRVVGCTFVGNSTDSDIGGGGAIQYYYGHGDAQLEIEDCTFVGNRAPDEGGAIWMDPGIHPASRVTIRNNLFVGNEAVQGGAIYVRSNKASTRIDNNTFIANKALGSAVFVVGEVYINNNIFAYNDCFGYWSWGPQGHSACGCNLFWENRSGEPGGTQWGGECDWRDEVGLYDGEQILDPEFCNRQGGDYSPRATSPGLPENFTERFQELGCEGRMGAFDVGCGFPPTIRRSWGELKQILGGSEEGRDEER